MTLWRVVLTAVLWGLCAAASAQSSAGQQNIDRSFDLPPGMADKTLIVGTKPAPPFVMRDGHGGYTGLSIVLWQRIARRLGLRTQFVQRDLDGLFTGLENHRLDISVAALTVTEAREARIDFTYPFYSTGLAIAVPKQGNRVWSALSRFFSWPFFTALGALAAVLLGVGVAVWLFERRTNAEEFGGTPVEGLASGFWWAAVTMTTVGYGDKSPRTLGGRVVGLVWMFAAIIIVSSFTAAIATSLTVGQLSSGITGVQDLAGERVETVADSAPAGVLAERGIAYRTSDSLAQALEDLAEHRVDAVVYDAPLLRYRVHQGYVNTLDVLARTFERQDYAFALPQGSPLREPINRAILAYLSTDQWLMLRNRYLGTP